MLQPRFCAEYAKTKTGPLLMCRQLQAAGFIVIAAGPSHIYCQVNGHKVGIDQEELERGNLVEILVEPI